MCSVTCISCTSADHPLRDLRGFVVNLLFDDLMAASIGE